MIKLLLFTGGTETFFTIPQQVFLFLASVLMGVALGVIYDIFRAFRVIFPIMRSKLMTAAADIIYMIIFGIGVFMLSAYMGRGEVRFFYCIGAGLGALTYIMTAGNAVLGVIKGISIRCSRFISKKRDRSKRSEVRDKK